MICGSSYTYSLAVVSVLHFGVCYGAVPNADGAPTRLKVIAEGALSNRETFLFLTSRFRLLHGTTDTEEQAIASGPAAIVVDAEGIWVVRQNQVRYELLVDESYIQRARRAALLAQRKDPLRSRQNGPILIQTNIKFASEKLLWADGRGIAFSPTIQGGGFSPPDKVNPQITITPFDMIGSMGKDEKMHPSRLIRDSFTNSEVVCRVDGIEEVDGRKLVVVSHAYVNSKDQPHRRFWLDPARGFLPVQMTSTYDDPEQRFVKTVVTEVRECTGGRWFPMRTVKMCFPTPAQIEQKIEVFELRVTELDVDKPPTDEMLAIDLPKGSHLHNGIEANSQITFQADQRVSVTDFDELSERMGIQNQKRLQEAQQMEPIALSEPSVSSTRWLVVVAGVVVLLLVTILILFYRRAARH